MTWRETKLNNLPRELLADLTIECFDCETVFNGTFKEISARHGWTGNMGYEQAKARLRGVLCDDSSQSIYFVDSSRGFAFKQDFDSDNVDFAIYALASSNNVVVDLTYQSGGIFKRPGRPGAGKAVPRKTITKRSSTNYGARGKDIFGNGSLFATQCTKIDDLSYPVYHKAFVLDVKQLKPATKQVIAVAKML